MASREVVAAHVSPGTERALLYKVPAGTEALLLAAFCTIDWDSTDPNDRHIELGVVDPNGVTVGYVIPSHNDAQDNIGDLTNRAQHALFYLQGDRDFDIVGEIATPTTRTTQSTPGMYLPEYWSFEWVCTGASAADQMSDLRCIVDECVPDTESAEGGVIPPYTALPFAEQVSPV